MPVLASSLYMDALPVLMLKQVSLVKLRVLAAQAEISGFILGPHFGVKNGAILGAPNGAILGAPNGAI